jgi:hypothetical protein
MRAANHKVNGNNRAASRHAFRGHQLRLCARILRACFLEGRSLIGYPKGSLDQLLAL